MKKIFITVLVIFFVNVQIGLARNTWNQSFVRTKEILLSTIYGTNHLNTTLYCSVSFHEDGTLLLPRGLSIAKYKNRARRIEWEHVVPVENFGHTFIAWREGDKLCIDTKSKPYKGRRCAEKVHAEFRYMQADMYNLYPVIGAVNAARSNYNFALLAHAETDFGICPMKIEGQKVEPPPFSRGQIARSYLYMQQSYPRFKMSQKQLELMQVWDKQYPVAQAECRRTKAIELVQGNENYIVKKRCMIKGLW